MTVKPHATPRRPDAELLALRRALLAILLASSLGITADLLLIGHTASVWQRVPFVLVGLCILSLAWIAVRPSPAAIRALRGALALVVAGVFAGVWLHGRANLEFEREIHPGVDGWALFWGAIRGAAPPSLAPASLLIVALSGLAWTWHHPARRRDEAAE